MPASSGLPSPQEYKPITAAGNLVGDGGFKGRVRGDTVSREAFVQVDREARMFEEGGIRFGEDWAWIFSVMKRGLL